ncbi:GNAT family N-acetyltransferase [Paenibacillus arenosi]|uniref:GNAT family N-acetyltransferase n=1 Tax=Paenibacillus arenosi TaxID=2774142 RepID=A0ABR9AYQ7_9BACL|nr:GNAT family N-acetyltransferase [Paenibacillus arenosi]MBD8499284.1 GNAT family N-acetyltransferase [Paenibacillus arenosi]
MEVIQTYDYELISKLNEEVQGLHRQLYPEYFKEYNYEEVKQFFKQVMTKDTNYFYAVRNGEQVMGYVWLEKRAYKENAFFMAYESIFLHHLIVLSAFRNSGVGKRLMETVYKAAESSGIKKIELDYWASNEVAKRFYEMRGFKRYREFLYKDLC